MIRSQSKGAAQTASTVDSFEANLLQIEHTNKLLANIENKLNNFFHKNLNHIDISPHQTRQRTERDHIHDHQSAMPTREDFVPNIGNTLLSPIQDKDSIQHFLSHENELNIRGSNHGNYIHIVGGSKDYKGNTEPEPLYEDRHREGVTPYRAAHVEVHEYPFQEMRNTSPHHKISERNQHSHARTLSQRSGYGESEGNNLRNINGRNGHRSPSRENMSENDRKFYEKKIMMLEERLAISEKETSHLATTRETLNSEIFRLKAQLVETQNKFVEDLNRSLKNQEERLRKEFSEHNKYYEGSQRDDAGYIEKIETLTAEKNRLEQDLHELRKQYERTRSGKDSISLPKPFENQKNDKSFKNSISEIRFSAGKSHDGRQSDNVKILMESLNMYKHELDVLKENNAMVQVQFEKEIQTLKDDLDYQKSRNTQLEDKIRSQNQILSKYHNISLELSQAKEGDGPSVKFDIDDTTVNHDSQKRNRDMSRDRDQIPFTNLDIKSGLTSQEGNRRGRGITSKDLQSTPKMKKTEKSRSKTRSMSKSGNRRPSEDLARSKSGRGSRAQKSPGTAYEEFEEELKRVKETTGTSSVSRKKRHISMSEKESKASKERKMSQDTGRLKEKSDVRTPATARGIQRSSPAAANSLKSSTSSKLKTSSRK